MYGIGLTNVGCIASSLVTVPVLLNVSNRSRVHASSAASTATWGSVSYHTLFCGVGRSLSTLDVGWANWSSALEVGSGGTCSIKLWIEYPLGTTPRQQVTWSGLTTGTLADGLTTFCDTVTLNTPIPDGAKVGIWAELVPTVALVFNDAHAKSTAWGDRMNIGAGGMTASSAAPADSGGGYFGPIAIRGLTTARSLVTYGDSRLAGVGDSATSTDGLNGEIGRTFGPRYAIMNMGIAGDTAQSFLSAHAKRVALAAYATDLFWEYGINDVVGTPPATCESQASTCKAFFPAKLRKARLTLVPASDSTNNWIAADGSDQTTKSYDANRRALNVIIAANAGGWDVVYDFATVNELPTAPTGKWKGDGVTAKKYTFDGVHESTFGNQQYIVAFPILL